MFCGSSDLGLHVRQHEPGTAYGNALAQSLERAAVSLKRTGAETPAVPEQLMSRVTMTMWIPTVPSPLSHASTIPCAAS